MNTRTTVIAALLMLGSPTLAVAAPDECQITATGDLTFSTSQKGHLGSVGTDYWMTEDELKMGLRAMVATLGGKKLSDTEKDAKVDEAMKKDPRFLILLLNCETKDASVAFGPARDTKYKHLPMKPGKYTVNNGMKARPGEISALLNIKADSGSWTPEPGGTFEITAWDKKHIAGTFELGVKTKDRKAQLKGSFDFPCRAGQACER
jgi:hypothetical protein